MVVSSSHLSGEVDLTGVPPILVLVETSGPYCVIRRGNKAYRYLEIKNLGATLIISLSWNKRRLP